MTDKTECVQKTLYDLFCDSYIHHLSNIAVVEDYGSGRRNMTYKELFESSTRISQTITEIMDCTNSKSQFIAMYMEQNLLFPAVVLGIISNGFGFAVVDPSWSEEKQRRFILNLGCPLLIRSTCLPTLWSEMYHLTCSVGDQEICIERITSCVPKRVRGCIHPMAYAIQTSGSTGNPKTVRVPHACIVPNIYDLRLRLNVNSNDVIFLSSPSTFDPSVIDIFLALTCGATLLVTSDSIKATPSALLKVLFPNCEVPGVSVLQMTPSLFSRWSEKDIKNIVFGISSQLRVLLLGGEPCLFLEKLMEWKVSVWASIHHVKNTFSCPRNFCTNETHEFTEPAVELGEVLTDTLFQVHDSKTQSIVTEGEGEMCIGSNRRICEIDDERCNDLSTPLYRFTGDIVKVSRGSFFYIGRKDHIFKRWGQRVNLKCIEQIALGHDSVSSACCVWDERKHHLSLFVVNSKLAERDSLQRHFLVTSQGDNSLIPDEIYFLDHLPMDHHGKVNRHILLKNLSEKQFYLKEAICLDLPSIPSRDFIMQWCRILGLQDSNQINPESSFVSLGGTSLLALVLTNHLVDRFGSAPDDLVGLLLSGTSFQSCLHRVTDFYNLNPPEREDSLASNTLADDESCEARVVQSSDVQIFPAIDSPVVIGASSSSVLSKLVSSSSQSKVYKSLSILKYSGSVNQKLLTISLTWKINLDKCIDASPLCLHYECGLTLVVIGSHSGRFVAIDGITGLIRWSLLLPHRIECTACSSLCGQLVYVGCYDGKLYCVEASSGEVKWNFQTGSMIKCSPILCNDGKCVLFGSYDHYIYCVYAETGELLWKSLVINPSGSWLASPLIISSVAIVCSLAAKIAAVETTTGALVWSKSVESPVFASPISLPPPSSSLFAVAEVCGVVHCFCSSTGKEMWRWDQVKGSHIFSSLSCAIFDSEDCDKSPTVFIMFGCHDSFIYCLQMTSTLEVALQWKFYTHSPVTSSPFVCFEKFISSISCVIVASSSGKLFFLNPVDGTIRSQYHLPFEIYSSPVAYNSRVYVGCRDDHVYCLTLKCDSEQKPVIQ